MTPNYSLFQFYDYLWGQNNFKLVTDHKQFFGFFYQTKIISLQASGRIKSWSFLTQSFNFRLLHRSGTLLGTTDALCRLPLPKTVSDAILFDYSPVHSRDIKEDALKDPILSKVYKFWELC